MRDRKAFLYPALIASLLTLACLPLILYGPQLGHSLQHNLSWSSAFTDQLLQGELYPRWLTNGFAGAGSPVFFFYAPIPFYFTAIGSLVCSDCSATVQLGIGEWLMILCSGFSFYWFARQYAIPLFAMIGAVLYALAPYHFAIDILQRQAIGEISACIWIPLILLSIGRMAEGKQAVTGLAISYALLIMSHLPSALLFSMFLPPYVFILKYYTSRPRLVSMSFLGLVVGIMLAAIYLLPALLSLDYISSHRLWGPYFHYDRWFFLNGIESPNPVFMQRLLKVLLTSALAFIPAWIIAYKYHSTHHRPLIVALLLFIATAWFMMLPGSRFVWELAPVLQKVQFPWRMFIIVDFAVAATLVLAFQCLQGVRPGRLILVPMGASGLFLAASAYVSAGDYSEQWKLHNDANRQPYLKSIIDMGWGAKEYIPSTVRLGPEELLKTVKTLDRVTVDPAAGEASVVGWQARNIHLKVNLVHEADILVRQFYYPGWQATLSQNGARLSLEATGKAGLIKLEAPPGRYDISLILQPLWQEVAGAIFSVIGLIAVIVLLARRGLQHIYSRKRPKQGSDPSFR
jgi:hypothetical protein